MNRVTCNQICIIGDDLNDRNTKGHDKGGSLIENIFTAIKNLSFSSYTVHMASYGEKQDDKKVINIRFTFYHLRQIPADIIKPSRKVNVEADYDDLPVAEYGI